MLILVVVVARVRILDNSYRHGQRGPNRMGIPVPSHWGLPNGVRLGWVEVVFYSLSLGVPTGNPFDPKNHYTRQKRVL